MSETGNGASFVRMITVGVIRNGATYLSHHLRKNDYWAEGEKEVQGEWIGASAAVLGLAGPVTDGPFEALRSNRHPKTGETLTALDAKRKVAFFDVQLSAPKDVSVLALVGGDERVRSAFAESVRVALDEMERFSAVRERRGEAAFSEKYRLTRNFVGALFHQATFRSARGSCHFGRTSIRLGVRIVIVTGRVLLPVACILSFACTSSPSDRSLAFPIDA